MKKKRKCPACHAEYEDDPDAPEGEKAKELADTTKEKPKANGKTRPAFPGVSGLECFQVAEKDGK